MTDWLLALVPQYGVWLMCVATFLSCLAVPAPTSILMLTAGGFVAAGDLVLWQVIAAAFAGAIAGDQTGYFIGWRGGHELLARLSREPSRAKLIGRAKSIMQTRGDAGIFLTRWLFSPLGPYANFAGGAIGFNWLRFTIAGALGEAVWVGLYIGLGISFGGNLEKANDYLGSILGIVAAGVVMLGLGMWLYSVARWEREAGV